MANTDSIVAERDRLERQPPILGPCGPLHSTSPRLPVRRAVEFHAAVTAAATLATLATLAAVAAVDGGDPTQTAEAS